LVIPPEKSPKALPAPASPPAALGVEKLLAAIVGKIGVEGVLNYLAANEKVAA
jgi:hypothetical protein